MKKYFAAVSKGTFAGQKASVLLKWLELYVRTLFPENGIYWWSDNQYMQPPALKADSILPGPSDIYHFACYVFRGNESPMIDIDFVARGGVHSNLTTIKIFAATEMCWQITAALEEALFSIFFYEEIPQIVEMSKKLPRKHEWYDETCLTEHVHIDRTQHSVIVRTTGGTVLDERDFSELGEGAHYAVDAYVADWTTVLTNMKAKIAQSATESVAELATS